MGEINQNRYDQLIRRVCGLQGPGSKVNDALTELFPMISVEQLPGELLILSGTDICFGGGTINAAPGQGGTGQVFNPLGSGVIATVTSFVFSTAVITPIRWGLTATPVTTAVGTETFRDTRRPFTQRPVCQIRQVSAVALATGTNQAQTNGGDQFLNTDPNGICVLAPGFGLDVGSDGTGPTIFYSFSWRERVAEPSELNF